MLNVQRNLVRMIMQVNQVEVLERVKNYNGRDTYFHNFQHCVVADHQFVSYDDLELLVEFTVIIKGKGKLRKRY